MKKGEYGKTLDYPKLRYAYFYGGINFTAVEDGVTVSATWDPQKRTQRIEVDGLEVPGNHLHAIFDFERGVVNTNELSLWMAVYRVPALFNKIMQRPELSRPQLRFNRYVKILDDQYAHLSPNVRFMRRMLLLERMGINGRGPRHLPHGVANTTQ